MKDTRNTGSAKGEPTEGRDADTPPALDDDTFVRLMEESFAASKGAGDDGGGVQGQDGSRDQDTALRDRVWEKLQARMAAEAGGSHPPPTQAESSTATTTAHRAGASPSAPDRGQAAPTPSKVRWGGPLVGLISLAAAVVFFVRMGGREGGLVPGNPPDLKGGEVAASRITLEARFNPTGRSYTFHATSVPAEVGAGVVLFAPEGGTPSVVARGRLVPEASSAPRTLVGDPGGSPVTWAPRSEAAPVSGRLCLFTAEGAEGLRSVEELAPAVFDRQGADLCQDIRVP